MQKTNNKILGFIKRNAFYLILSLCIIAVGVSLLLVLTGKENRLPSNQVGVETPGDSNLEKPNENEPPVDNINPPEEVPVVKPIEFINPVEDSTAIVDYSEQMVFNSTLNRYSAHLAIDFIANEGAEVSAVYDGVVSKVETTFLQGTTITIDHGNGLFSVYNSLADGDMVSVGKSVKQGDVIGLVSATNRQEADKGAHLHFSVIESGEVIDPAKYLTLDNK